MRLGEKGVLSLEQWLEQEAAAVRDAEISAAAAAAAGTPVAAAAVSGRKQVEDATRPRHETVSTGAVSSATAAVAADGGGNGAGGGEPSAINGTGKGPTGVGGFRVGVDPWLLSAGTARSLTTKLAESGGCLVPISG